jgi:hypothetical protein
VSWKVLTLVAAAMLVTVVGWWQVVADGLTTDSDIAPAFLTWIAVGFGAIALTGERHRPGDSLWLLAAGLAVVTPLAYFSALSTPMLAAIGAFVWLATPLLPAHLLLAYPEGTRSHRRRVVTGCWVVPALLAVLTIAVSPPRRSSVIVPEAGQRALFWIHQVPGTDSFLRQGNPFLVHASTGGVRVLWVLWSVWIIGVTALVAVLLWRRLRRADRAARRVVGVVYTAGLLWCVAQFTRPLLAFPAGLPLPGAGARFESVLFARWYSDIVLLAVPIAISGLAGALGWAQLLRPRLSRTPGGALRVVHAEGTSADRLRESLVRTLGDPTVRVVFRLPSGSWVDETGRAAEPTSGPDRVAIVVLRGGEEIAAIEHDVSLLAQPDLIEVAATMAGLALDNQRLHAEVLARIEEVRESGARLFDAADQARAAFEARVLAGPDATLARVAGLIVSPQASAAVLEEIYAGLRTAVAQVREIAHGLYPLSLIEDGLAVALDDLAGKVDVPLRVLGAPTARLPATIEITCYLAVAGAAAQARGPVHVAFDLGTELVCRIENVAQPPGPMVMDRTAAVGGTIDARDGCTVLHLPLPARMIPA